jgi:O-antigen/teichoic acid export membrane protein
VNHAGSWALARLAENRALISNTALTTCGTAISSLLGFAYWWMAARTFEPEQVGIASALVSAMALVGLLGEAGFGTLLIGGLRKLGQDASNAITASLLAVAFSSAVAGGVALCIMARLTHDGIERMIFVAGCALTGAALVTDQASIGLLCGGLQLLRNFVFSALKLLLLAAIVALPSLASAAALTVSWIISIAISIGVVAIVAHTRHIWQVRRPNFGLLYANAGDLISYHIPNLASQAPTLIMPALVASLLSSAVNAPFFCGWMLLSIAQIVPSSMTLVLFSIGARDAGSLPSCLRFSLLSTMVFALGVALFLLTFADPILGLFNPAYPAVAGTSLQIAGFALFGLSLKFHYLAIMRMQRRMWHATPYLVAGCLLEIVLAGFGALFGGLPGLAAAWVGATVLEGAFVLPLLLKSSMRHRHMVAA